MVGAGEGSTVATGNEVIEAPIPAAVVSGRKDAVGPGGERAGRMVFLDVIRAAAVLLVVYDHLVAYWRRNGGDSPVVGVIDGVLRGPLRLEQNFGYFGVALFFLVSGFVVTHRAVRERPGEFAVKRILRIYPVLIVVVAYSSLPGLRVPLLGANVAAQVTPFTVFTNMTLANYVLVPQVSLAGVAWTLIVEVLFYLLLLALMAVLKKQIWVALLIEMALCWAIAEFARDLGPNIFLLANAMIYLPVLLLGQICWAVWSRRIPLWAAGIFGLTAWSIYTWAGPRIADRPDDGYGNAVALGLLVFVTLLLLEPRLRPNRIVSYLADRSYSIYLWHGVTTFPVLVLLNDVPPLLAMLIALLATGLTVEGSYRFLERPAQQLARRLTRSRLAAGRTR